VKLPNYVSETIKRLNPNLFVRRVDSEISEPDPRRALVEDVQAREKSSRCVAYRVVLVAHRKRLVDDDNNVAGCKPLRDAIAETLRIDDGDERIQWEYGQVKTSGTGGVFVIIEKTL
jgi:hypothetical protein